MKKKMFRWIALFACACMSFSIFTGCINNITEGNEESTITDNVVDATDDYEDGTHDFEVTETEKNFLSGGMSNYKIIYPSVATEFEQTAVSEFNHIFQMATDLTLPTSNDGGLTHTESAKYISIGNTNLLKTSGLNTDVSDLGRDGCKVVTKDNTVYIFGGSEGVIYGVYDFMAETFNYEYYYDDCITIDKNVTDMKLKNYNIKDVPDILHRWIGWAKLGRQYTNVEMMSPTRFRMRYGRGSNIIKTYADPSDTSTHGGTHNSLECLPKEKYGANHPNWYSNKGNQLCWSAGCAPEEFANGNIPAEFEAMAQAISANLQISLTMYPTAENPEFDTYNLGVEDNNAICQCKGCAKWMQKYGTMASVDIVLMNRVAEITDAWMAQEGNEPYRRDLQYIFLAYGEVSEAAPVNYDETQEKYVPIDDLVTPRDNVGVYLAMIKSFEYQLSIYDEMNAHGREMMTAWADITDHLYMWLYQVNYRCDFLLYDSFNYFNDGYKYVVSQQPKALISQGTTGGNRGVHSAWGNLKMYLESKLMWNGNLDTEVLIDNWFNAMFKDGADEMKQMFNEQRAWLAYIRNEYKLHQIRSNFLPLQDEAKYWSLPMLRGWMNLCDKAIADIEKYKTTDPDLYEATRRHIEAEWIAPTYILLNLYSQNLSSEDRNTIVARFASDVELFDIDIVGGSNDTSLLDFIAQVS